MPRAYSMIRKRYVSMLAIIAARVMQAMLVRYAHACDAAMRPMIAACRAADTRELRAILAAA